MGPWAFGGRWLFESIPTFGVFGVGVEDRFEGIAGAFGLRRVFRGIGPGGENGLIFFVRVGLRGLFWALGFHWLLLLPMTCDMDCGGPNVVGGKMAGYPDVPVEVGWSLGNGARKKTRRLKSAGRVFLSRYRCQLS